MNISIEPLTNTADKKSLALDLMNEWNVSALEIVEAYKSITMFSMKTLSDSLQSMIAYDYLPLTECNTTKEAVIEIASFIN